MSYDQEPESNGVVRMLLVVGGMVVLCAIVVILGLFFYLIPQQQQAQTASATSTAEVMAQLEATRAARPTITPRPTRTTAPTQTPRPTRTPVPTVAPTPTLDPALVEYATFFFGSVFSLEEAFFDLAILNEQARLNPVLLSDSEWLTNLTRTTTMIEAEAQRVLDFPFDAVPSVFVASHTKLAEAMVLYRDSMVLYREGITVRDSVLISNAFANFERANGLIGESGELLPTFE